MKIRNLHDGNDVAYEKRAQGIVECRTVDASEREVNVVDKGGDIRVEVLVTLHVQTPPSPGLYTRQHSNIFEDLTSGLCGSDVHGMAVVTTHALHNAATFISASKRALRVEFMPS